MLSSRDRSAASPSSYHRKVHIYSINTVGAAIDYDTQRSSPADRSAGYGSVRGTAGSISKRGSSPLPGFDSLTSGYVDPSTPVRGNR